MRRGSKLHLTNYTTIQGLLYSIHPLSMAAATAAHPSSDHRQRRDLSHDKALVGLLSDKASCSLYGQHAKGLRRVGIGRLRGWHSEACPRMYGAGDCEVDE